MGAGKTDIAIGYVTKRARVCQIIAGFWGGWYLHQKGYYLRS